MQRRSLIGAAGLATLLAANGSAWARTYPTRPLRLIVPFPPGGGSDTVMRIVADELALVLGQQVVVENRPGAGGAIGTNEIARAAPDGYTLGLSTVSTNASGPAINPRTPYHPINDFTPIVKIAAMSSLIAVHPSFPARDYESFLREIRRAAPGHYSYATPGQGTLLHLLGELFELETRTFMVHIAYRGSAPALLDVLPGRVPIIVDILPSLLPHIQAGRLIPIVAAAPQRLAQLPNVPTFTDVGLPRVNRMGFFGIQGPRGLPREVVERIHAATLRILADPALRRRIEDTGSLLVENKTSEQLAEHIRREFEIYQRLVQTAGLRLD